ncbi:MAG: hypothetical protein R6W76_01970 [Caldilinea sp.]
MLLAILLPIAIFLLVLLVVLGGGVVIGYFLNWILPAIGLGSAVVAGAIANIFTLYVMVRFFNMRSFDSDPRDEDEGTPPRTVLYSLEPPSRRTPRRKRRPEP